MHFFGYGFVPPYLTYHVVDAAGYLITSRALDLPGPTMMHDFNLTERFVVFMDLPIVFDLSLAMGGSPLPYCYDVSYGARLAVLRRDDPHGALRWFDIEPCYVFHASTLTTTARSSPSTWPASMLRPSTAPGTSMPCCGGGASI